jgi:chaperonin GroES
MQAKVVKTEGLVVEVGPGKLHPDSGKPFPMPVEEGDSVIYGKYDGTELVIDGDTHSLIRDDDILVKFKGSPLSEANAEVVNENVLVLVETKEVESSGGLILGSGSDQKRPSTGVVVKLGPGRMVESGEFIPMNVKVGDQIKFMDFAGNEIKIGEKEYSVVKMPEILAKF